MDRANPFQKKAVAGMCVSEETKEEIDGGGVECLGTGGSCGCLGHGLGLEWSTACREQDGPGRFFRE